jgi:hypothetical protein
MDESSNLTTMSSPWPTGDMGTSPALQAPPPVPAIVEAPTIEKPFVEIPSRVVTTSHEPVSLAADGLEQIETKPHNEPLQQVETRK